MLLDHIPCLSTCSLKAFDHAVGETLQRLDVKGFVETHEREAFAEAGKEFIYTSFVDVSR